MSEIWVPVVGSICALGVLPAIVFNFIFRIRRLRVEEKDIEARTEQLRLEIERERIRLAIAEIEAGRKS